MKKSEVARIMYDLQEYCKRVSCYACEKKKFCKLLNKAGYPEYWGITKADVERLRNKETFTCKDCRHYQCRVSVFSTSKVCEKFELWQ